MWCIYVSVYIWTVVRSESTAFDACRSVEAIGSLTAHAINDTFDAPVLLLVWLDRVWLERSCIPHGVYNNNLELLISWSYPRPSTMLSGFRIYISSFCSVCLCQLLIRYSNTLIPPWLVDIELKWFGGKLLLTMDNQSPLFSKTKTEWNSMSWVMINFQRKLYDHRWHMSMLYTHHILNKLFLYSWFLTF